MLFCLGNAGGILRLARFFPEDQAVVVVREGIAGLLVSKYLQVLFATRERLRSGLFHLAEKEERLWIPGIEVRGFAHLCRRFHVLAVSVVGGAKTRVQSFGVRVQLATLGEDLDGRGPGAMQQELRAPSKVVCFAGIDSYRSFVLFLCRDRIATFFLGVSRQSVGLACGRIRTLLCCTRLERCRFFRSTSLVRTLASEPCRPILLQS